MIFLCARVRNCLSNRELWEWLEHHTNLHLNDGWDECRHLMSLYWQFYLKILWRISLSDVCFPGVDCTHGFKLLFFDSASSRVLWLFLLLMLKWNIFRFDWDQKQQQTTQTTMMMINSNLHIHERARELEHVNEPF